LCLNGCTLFQTIQDGSIREAGVYLQHKQGHRVLVAVRTIPAKVNGETIGAVEVFVDDKEKAYIQNTINKLKDLALSDALTGLPNRRYIDTFLESRFPEYRKLNIPFALAMIDVDDFRMFNNIYGHDVGDEVLKMFAMTMKNTIRRNDMVGRWGGEEFVAVFSGVDTDIAFRIAEKVRLLIQESVLKREQQELGITVSIGITMARADDTAESIVQRADNALYKSKNHGKNICTLS
jgi:diguanylate cyclase (GGDEF)-like protein